MSGKTLEQERAQNAWRAAVKGVEDHGKDYANLAKSLPALIMNSGLMQVMAFLQQKGGRHALLGEQLRAWLSERFPLRQEFEGFMQDLFEGKAPYQAVTQEAMAWLKWLRQLAPAYQATKEGEN